MKTATCPICKKVFTDGKAIGMNLKISVKLILMQHLEKEHKGTEVDLESCIKYDF